MHTGPENGRVEVSSGQGTSDKYKLVRSRLGDNTGDTSPPRRGDRKTCSGKMRCRLLDPKDAQKLDSRKKLRRRTVPDPDPDPEAALPGYYDLVYSTGLVEEESTIAGCMLPPCTTGVVLAAT